MMAMVAWLGGLPPLWAAIAASRRNPQHALPLQWLIPKYSAMAMLCVVLLAWTGILSYNRHVGQLNLLAATTYGRALTVKLALFALLLALGAINFLSLSRRLRQTDDALRARFGQTVAGEVVIGTLVLAAVGLMTAIAPSRAAWQAQAQSGGVERATSGDVELTLRVAPGLVGDNALALDVTDSRPAVSADGVQVLFRISAPGRADGPLQIEALAAPQSERADPSGAASESIEPQRFQAHGNFFTSPGTWRVEAILRRQGMNDVRQLFTPDILREPDATMPPGR